MLGAMLVERSIEQKVHLHEATGEHVNFNDLFAGLWKCFCTQAASILHMHQKQCGHGALKTDFSAHVSLNNYAGFKGACFTKVCSNKARYSINACRMLEATRSAPLSWRSNEGWRGKQRERERERERERVHEPVLVADLLCGRGRACC